MGLVIQGIGTALPAVGISQSRAAEVAINLCCKTEEQASVIPNLFRQTGIQNRHLAFTEDVVADLLNGTNVTGSVYLPEENENHHGPTTGQRMRTYVSEVLPLGIEAARVALGQSTLVPADFTHLVTVSCTGFSAPGLDIGLIQGLELPATIERVQVGFMGCHGAINGLRVAEALVRNDPRAHVLLCAVELCSLHYFYGWDPKKIVANALFADGAAALVGSDAGEKTSPWQAVATGSSLFPNSEYAMTWNIGDHGFDMTLSTRVPSLIGAHLRPWLEDWLGRRGFRVSDIGSWAVHPGGPRILSAVEECLKLASGTLAVSREVLAECGNMSSPTILFIINRLRQRNAPRPCVALAFGPGLTAETALFI